LLPWLHGLLGSTGYCIKTTSFLVVSSFTNKEMRGGKRRGKRGGTTRKPTLCN